MTPHATHPGETRVLCVAGSPRRGGNSDRLLDALAEGVQSAGGVPVRLVPSAVPLAPCRGCNACAATGACAVNDAMDEVYPLLDSADAIAVCSPVYFATVPAVLKALYDRCQPYWARRYLLHQPRRPVRRPGALVIVGGGGDPFGTRCVETPTRSVFGVLEVELTELFEFVGADASGEIAAHPEALARAREIGVSLVQRAARP